MRAGRRRPRPRIRALSSGTLPTLVFLTLPPGGQAQTVEPRYEPHAAGAATIIYPDETALGARDVVDLLQWHVPGATVGRCGSMVAVTLRGGRLPMVSPGGDCPTPGNPLLIIDGVKISNDNFSSEIRSLNPFRVERLEVLRDLASTAVYGTRGARGVILIFTRRR